MQMHMLSPQLIGQKQEVLGIKCLIIICLSGLMWPKGMSSQMKPIDPTLKIFMWQSHKTAIPMLTKVKMAIFESLNSVVYGDDEKYCQMDGGERAWSHHAECIQGRWK